MQESKRTVGRAARVGALVGVALIVLLAGCCDSLRILPSESPSVGLTPNPSSRTDAIQPPSGDSAAASDLEVLSFNAGLAPGVIPRVEERVTRIAERLEQDDFDVACLQEVWLPRHQATLKEALTQDAKATWLSPEPESVAGLHCADSELTSLIACVVKNCRQQSDAATCSIQRCRGDLDNLRDDCAACLSKDLDDPLASLARCAAPAAEEEDAGLSPKPKAYLLGGSYGTALVSRLPVLDVEYTPFASSMHPRGVIHARLAHPSLGPIDTYCTHLTPYLRGMKRPPASQFIVEQSQQVEKLSQLISRRKKPHGNVPVVLLGDLNTGPGAATDSRSRDDDGTYQARLPQHFTRLLSETELLDAASGQRDECTFCYDNPLQAHPESGGLRIDHVLFRDLAAGRVTYERTFVEPALSDHYGVRAVFRL